MIPELFVLCHITIVLLVVSCFQVLYENKILCENYYYWAPVPNPLSIA